MGKSFVDTYKEIIKKIKEKGYEKDIKIGEKALLIWLSQRNLEGDEAIKELAQMNALQLQILEMLHEENEELRTKIRESTGE